MTTPLTIPEMASHMRRLVEGMILDGHLRPAWATGYEPVRVGTELGWRPANSNGSLETLVSSEQLFESVVCRAPGPLEKEFLFRKKGFPVRWNAEKSQEQWGLLEGWWSLDEAIQLVAFLAMGRRAGQWSPEAYENLVKIKARTSAIDFRSHMMSAMDDVLDPREKYAALCHFLEDEPFEEVSQALGITVPATVHLLQCAATKLQLVVAA